MAFTVEDVHEKILQHFRKIVYLSLSLAPSPLKGTQHFSVPALEIALWLTVTCHMNTL